MYKFKRDLGPKSLAIRIGGCLMLLIFTYFMKGGTPRAREDREWLLTFCLVMLIFFGIMHSLAYVQSQYFGSIGDMVYGARNVGSYAVNNFNEMQWCAVLLLTLIAIWPFVAFFLLIRDGFDPYDELTDRELKLNRGGLAATILRMGRIVLHLYLMVVAVYLLILFILFILMRNLQRRPGQYTSWAMKLSRLPYGAIFFEPGEMFDCPLCLTGLSAGSEVVKLESGEVYRPSCLKDYIELNNRTCIISKSPIVIAKPPPKDKT